MRSGGGLSKWPPRVALVCRDDAIARGLHSLLHAHGHPVAVYRDLRCLAVLVKLHPIRCAIVHVGRRGDAVLLARSGAMASLAGRTRLIIVTTGTPEIARLQQSETAPGSHVIALPLEQGELLRRVEAAIVGAGAAAPSRRSQQAP